MTSYLRSSEIMRFEMLLLLKVYFVCSQFEHWKSDFFNSNLSFSAELKILAFEHTKMFNSEVKKKNPDFNCIRIIT